MKTRNILSAFALSVALITPAIVKAQPQPTGGTAMVDDQHRDFTADDERAWHDYLKEHHKKDHEWARASKREQADYWKWRESHRDEHHDDRH
jgi:hypothetical protein